MSIYVRGKYIYMQLFTKQDMWLYNAYFANIYTMLSSIYHVTDCRWVSCYWLSIEVITGLHIPSILFKGDPSLHVFSFTNYCQAIYKGTLRQYHDSKWNIPAANKLKYFRGNIVQANVFRVHVLQIHERQGKTYHAQLTYRGRKI